MRNIYITLIIAMMLVLAGCGGGKECPPTCDDGNPCTIDDCGKETGYECSNTPIPGCSLDCGVPCSGAAGQYMEMQCDPATKQCASNAKPGLKISTSSLTNEMQSAGNRFSVITTYNLPFNVKKDLFNVKISLSQIGTGLSEIKIKKIEMFGMDANRNTVTLGEKTVNKYAWTTETDIEEGVRIDFPTSENDGQFTNIRIRIGYEYMQEYGGQVQARTATFEITLRGVTFTWFKPGMTGQCPSSCDDLNPGTADVCNAQTGYFCEHQPIPGKCGNFACDPTENKCTCAEDCGPCEGDAGRYLSFMCQANECRTAVKSGVIQEPVSKLDEKNRNFYYLQNKYIYKNPFNVNADSFEIEFSLYSKQDAVGAVRLLSAKLLDRTSEIASVNIGKALNIAGDKAEVSFPSVQFAGYEEDKSLSIKIEVEYDFTTVSGTEQRKDSFTTSLGTVTMINPTLS
ncbi:hypothetical protein JW707_01480 [Candidatus Woesearchaeota archaeon]|nr:hypothetical protein [Candidatus Woesearchaeota archaeon]